PICTCRPSCTSRALCTGSARRPTSARGRRRWVSRASLPTWHRRSRLCRARAPRPPAPVRARVSVAASPRHAPGAEEAAVAAPGSELGALLGDDAVLDGSDPVWSRDATETRGIEGHADAVVFPRSADEVARVLVWCYEHDVPLTPRGGGS